jgi:hypothetical protein
MGVHFILMILQGFYKYEHEPSILMIFLSLFMGTIILIPIILMGAYHCSTMSRVWDLSDFFWKQRKGVVWPMKRRQNRYYKRADLLVLLAPALGTLGMVLTVGLMLCLSYGLGTLGLGPLGTLGLGSLGTLGLGSTHGTASWSWYWSSWSWYCW